MPPGKMLTGNMLPSPSIFQKPFFLVLLFAMFTSSLVSFNLETASAQARRGDSFVYSDLENFLDAIEIIREGRDSAITLQEHYLDQASPGLKEYITRFDVTADSLATAVETYPDYFASLETLPTRLRAMEGEILDAYAELRKWLPRAFIPPVYYVVGGLKGGGQASQAGILIGADVFAAGEQNGTFKPVGRRVYTPDNIPFIVSHELIHIQQVLAQGLDKYRSIYGSASSVLAIAIREGSAEFLGHMISGGVAAPEALAYVEAHEADIWPLFRDAQDNEEPGLWFFRTPDERPNWPADVGYAMGFMITKAYYENAPDKKRAIQEILNVTDYEGFLEKSGYAGGFQ